MVAVAVGVAVVVAVVVVVVAVVVAVVVGVAVAVVVVVAVSRAELPRRLRARLALSALNWKYGPEGWRIYASDRGRLWAFTSSAERRDYDGVLWTGLADAVDADSPRELAAKLEKRSKP